MGNCGRLGRRMLEATYYRVWSLAGCFGGGSKQWGVYAMDWMLSESGSKSVVAYLNKPDLQEGET